MSAFTNELNRLMATHDVERQLPLPNEAEKSLAAYGLVPPELVELYSVTNGLEWGWFRVLPIQDRRKIKQTWDSIQRANDPTTTMYLRWEPALLNRFLVFADIGDRNCAVFDRTDFSIWYEEGDLHQTDLTLLGFIETEIAEVEAGSQGD